MAMKSKLIILKSVNVIVLKENDMDSRTDLELVEGVLINTTGHYRF